MFIRALVFAAGLVLPSSAFAQIPDPLDAALSVVPGDANPEAIIFRMTLSGESIRVGVSFEDDDGPVYRLIEPTSEAYLTEQQAEMWAGFGSEDEAQGEARSEDEDLPDTEEGESYSVGFGDYDPEALREAIGETVVLIGETDGRLTYEFTPTTLPGQGETPDEMMEHMRGEVVVDARLNQLEVIRFTLAESFKPHMAARINAFLLEQRFVHEPAIDGPRMAGVTMSMEGSAMFQSFSQSMQFDIEEVRFPQVDSGGG